MFGRQKIAALVAEFLGTGVLTLLTISVLRSQLAVGFFIALAAGLAVTVMTFAFSHSSSANFNPALTIGLFTARQISAITAALYIIVQLLGAWAAYGLYHYFASSSLQNAASHFSGRILVAEAVGMGIFAMGWAAAYYRRYSPAVMAAFAGLSYIAGLLLAATAFGISFVNPAVALGVRAWDIWGSMGWGTYVLGPVLGGIIGVNLYSLLFALPANEVLVAGEAASVATAPAAAVTKRPAARSRAAKAPAAARKTRATASRSTRSTGTRRRTTTRRSTSR